jgi:Mce-associated membrane protein
MLGPSGTGKSVFLKTGPFKQEYATTMHTTIAPVAETTKSVVRARTYEAGVMSQGDDTVTVQLFLNQARTAEGQDQPSVDQNRVIATMQRVEGRWLVARLSAY